MAVVWSNENILTLIEMYQNSQLLWDTSHRDYKNKIKKNDAWESIATTLDIPRKDVEGKMHNLRSQFLRERKKIASSKSTGSGSGDVHKSTWFAYDSLLFLVKGSTSSGSMDTMNTQSSESSVALEEIPVASQVLTQPPEASTSPPLPTQPIPVPLPNTQNKRKKDDLSEVYEIMKSAKARMDQPKDEFQVYADYVASELRNIKNEHAVLQAKYFINNILLEARMGKYNYAEYQTGSNSSHTQSYGYRSAPQQSSYSTNSVNDDIVTANASHVNNDNEAPTAPTFTELRQIENIEELVSRFESETQNKE
ncbi:uncharacterized protein LOC123878298 [Maniola jurtina]|uniref:uncharacterized protein LOC123878298 n=1 Tax=Maniola jurtina TaxID=191418 RepID=UPI001E68DE32|nr:uncharacterized protein LOC123878298 [Maniola jurtina]